MIAVLPLLQISAGLIGLYGAITAAQWLVDMSQWRDGRALGWDLQSLRRGRLARSRAVALVSAPPGLTLVAVVQLGVSLELLFMPGTAALIGLLGCFLVTELLLSLRSGADGGDKIVAVAASGALLQAIGLQFEAQRFVLAGILWSGGQLTLAYFASGASKLGLVPWRNGQALRAALTSYMWGHRWAAAVVRHASAARLLAWAIILLELAFPLALLLPVPWLCGVLGLFLLFHLAIAVVMGLNHYPWAFAATYPAVVLLGQWLRAGLGIG